MGPLAGCKIIELASIGPGPFCGMMLADMGAEVIRIDRIGATMRIKDVLSRGRRSIMVNLKSPAGVALVLDVVANADALFEGFRPGVAERLGLGPADCLARNPKLVYGRITGWGQDGPLASAAGHDINYIGLAGALHAIGRAGERPVPPLNLVGDFGGGGMLLAFGLVCGLLEARQSGQGQVIDAAMLDGVASLMAMFFSFAASGMFKADRGTNLLDGGAHFYDTYETRDGKHVCIGSIEPQFYALLLKKAKLDQEAFGAQMDTARWPTMKADLARVFKTKTQEQWCEILEGSDVCFAPVLSIFEAPQHPHNKARNTFVEVDGVTQPGPAPRFNRTVPDPPGPISKPGRETRGILSGLGMPNERIEALIAAGVVAE